MTLIKKLKRYEDMSTRTQRVDKAKKLETSSLPEVSLEPTASRFSTRKKKLTPKGLQYKSEEITKDLNKKFKQLDVLLKNFAFVSLNSEVSDEIRQASFDVQNALRKTESVLAEARSLLAIENYTDLKNTLLKFEESFKKTTRRTEGCFTS